MKQRIVNTVGEDRPPRYLTNKQPFEGIAEVVAAAAKEAGMDVRWSDTPMPDSANPGSGYSYDRAVADGWGSIINYDPSGNASPFWRAFERLSGNR